MGCGSQGPPSSCKEKREGQFTQPSGWGQGCGGRAGVWPGRVGTWLQPCLTLQRNHGVEGWQWGGGASGSVGDFGVGRQRALAAPVCLPEGPV